MVRPDGQHLPEGRVERPSARAKEHHDNLHRTAHGWIEGFVPKAYSPFVAAVISYALLVCPFLVAYNIFHRLGHVLSLQKLLMAINIYNATYCAMLVVFNLWTGNEPMASLQESNEADTSSSSSSSASPTLDRRHPDGPRRHRQPRRRT